MSAWDTLLDFADHGRLVCAFPITLDGEPAVAVRAAICPEPTPDCVLHPKTTVTGAFYTALAIRMRAQLIRDGVTLR